MSKGFYENLYKCPVTKVTDSGWGQSIDSYNCWRGSPTYKLGHPVSDFRELRVEGTTKDSNGACTLSGTERIIARKDRDLRCPVGFSALTGPDGSWVGCYGVKDNSCPINNPVMPGGGGQVKTEVDYADNNSSPLTLVRTFSPQNDYQPIGNDFPDVSRFGVGWAFNYGMRLDFVANSATVFAVATRPDGQKIYFDQTGRPLHRLDNQVIALRALEGGKWELVEGTRRETYASDGLLESVETSGSGRVTLTYDRVLNTIQVTDPTRRRILITLGASGLIKRIDYPDGSYTSYTYNEKSSLIQVVYSGASSKRYNLDFAGSNPVFDVFDEAGRWYSRHEYGSIYTTRQQVVSSRLSPAVAGGAIGSITYSYQDNADGSTNTTVTDAVGGVSNLRFGVKGNVRKLLSQSGSCASCGGFMSSIEYDALGYRSASTDFNGVQTKLIHNARGQLLSHIEAANDTTGKKRTTQTDWHPAFNVPVERRVLNADNTLTSKETWTYNARGQTLTASRIDPATGSARTTTTTYCEATDIAAGQCPLEGLITSVDGPRTDINDTVSYTYYLADARDCADAPTTCAHRKGDLRQVTNALGHATTFLAYDGAGRVLSQQDARGVVTDFEYHPRGWLAARKVRGPNNSSEADDRITRIDYWPTGLVSFVHQPDGSFTAFAYDDAHRLTEIYDNIGNKIQ